MKEKTGMILAHAGEEYDQYFNAIVPPVFMNSLNIFPTVEVEDAPEELLEQLPGDKEFLRRLLRWLASRDK